MRFRMYKLDNDDTFQYQLVSNDDQLILTSPTFPDREACVANIRDVIQQLRQAENFEIFQEDDNYYFRLRDTTGNILNLSQPFPSEDLIQQTIASLNAEANTTENFEVTFSTTSPTTTAGNTPAFMKEVNYDDFYDFNRLSPTGQKGFEPFQGDDTGEHYFHFNDDDGNPLIYSRSFPTAGKRDKRIRVVINNSANPDRYETIERNGVYYFIIKAKNGQEIARSKPFDNPELIDIEIQKLQQLIPTYKPQFAVEKKERKPKSVNEYILTQPSTSGQAGFEQFRNQDNKQYYFHFNDPEGNAILFSEGYASSRSRDNGIKSVIKNGIIDNRYEIKETEGTYYFVLKAGNRQEIARSNNFTDRESLEKILAYVKSEVINYAETYNVNLPATTSTESFTLNLPEEEETALVDQEGSEKVYNVYDLAQPSTSNQAGFESFQSDKNAEYYFHFNGEDGQALLFSEGYKSTNGRDNGIKSVIKNGSIEERFARKEEDGKYYFILIAGNNQEIARSRYFDTEGEMEEAMNYVQQRSPFYATTYNVPETDLPEQAIAFLTASTPTPSKRVVDQYDFSQASTSQLPGFETFKSDKDQEHYFHFNDPEGNAFLFSEGYKAPAGRDNGLRSVIKNASLEERYLRHQEDDKYYFTLLAGNKQEIARSKYFDNEEERDNAIAYLQQRSPFYATTYNVPETDLPEQAIAFLTASTPTPSKRVVDQYDFSQASTSQLPGFETFKSDKDQEHYFHFNDSEGNAFLFSEGYKAPAGRDNGLRSVIKNASLEERYLRHQEDDKYYFTLLAGNKQEIARSKYFDNEEERDNAIAYLQQRSPFYATTYNVPETDLPEQAIAFLAASTPTPSKRVVDQYDFSQASTSQLPGFETFKSDKDQEHYFHFNDPEGNAFLFSEGYKAPAGRDNGLRSVIKNASLEERYLRHQEDDKYYFTLLAGNKQEIARSKYFDNEEERDNAIAYLQQRSPFYATTYNVPETDLPEQAIAFLAASTPTPSKRVVDQYDFSQASTSQLPGFETFKSDKDQEHYFHFNDPEGNAFLFSEGYKAPAGRDNGLRSVIKNASLEERYLRHQEDDKYYFTLLAGNKQEIARSKYFDNEEERDNAIAYLQQRSPFYATTYNVPETDLPEQARIQLDTSTPTPGASIIDQYDFTQHSTSGQSGFEPFKSEKNSEFYFHFNDSDGNPLLYSEGYTSAQARDNGIRSVIRNSTGENIVEKEESGEFYFVILAPNGQEIARSKSFTSKDEVENAVSYFKEQAPQFAEYYGVDLPSADDDQYIAGRYYLNPQSHSQEAGFDPYQDELDGLFYYYINDLDGKPFFYSRSNDTSSERDDDIRWMVVNGSSNASFILQQDERGFYYTTYNQEGEEVGRTRYFESEEEAANLLQGFQAQLPAYIERYERLEDEKSPADGKSQSSQNDDQYIAGRYYLNPQSYSQRLGFDPYQDELDGLYYYYFNDAQGKPFFYSRSNDTDSERDDDIRWMIEYSPSEASFMQHQDDRGHYYTVHNEQGEELGRTRYFDNAEDAQAALFAFQSAVPAFAKDYGVVFNESEADIEGDPGQEEVIHSDTEDTIEEHDTSDEENEKGELVDGYFLSYQSYSGQEGIDPYYREADGLYYFQYNDNEGNPYFFSKGYFSEEDRDQAIRATIRAAEFGDYELNQDNNGYFYILRDTNGKELGRTAYFDTLENADLYKSYLISGLPNYADRYEVEIGQEVPEQEEASSPSGDASDAVIGTGLLVGGYYLGQKSFSGNPGYDPYVREEDGLYYFQYNDDNGNPFFFSQGYGSENERDEALKDSIRFADNGQYRLLEDDYGYYYILLSDDGRELGRTGYFKSPEEANKYIYQFQHAAPSYADQYDVSDEILEEPVEEIDSSVEDEAEEQIEIEDETGDQDQEETEETDTGVLLGAGALVGGYLLGRKGTTDGEGFEKFEFDHTDPYFFQLNDENGNGLLYSQGYTTADDRDYAIREVATYAESGQFIPHTEDGQHYFILTDDQARPLGRSRFFDSRSQMDEYIAWFKTKATPLASAIGLPAIIPDTPPALPTEDDSTDLSTVPPAEETKPAAVSEDSPGWLSRNWPWLLLLLLLLLALMFLLRSCNNGGGVPPVSDSAQGEIENNQPVPIVADSLSSDSTQENINATAGDPETEEGTNDLSAQESTSGSGVVAVPDNTTEGASGAGNSRGEEEEDSNSSLLGPDAAALNFNPNTMEGKMANFLADPTNRNKIPSDPFIMDNAYFSFDSHVLNKKAYPQLDKLAKLMRNYPGLSIEIRGHRNKSEKQQYVGQFAPDGIPLSAIRARCIYRKLIPRGISANRMTFKGFDDTQPLNDESTESELQENRRIEIILVDR